MSRAMRKSSIGTSVTKGRLGKCGSSPEGHSPVADLVTQDIEKAEALTDLSDSAITGKHFSCTAQFTDDKDRDWENEE